MSKVHSKSNGSQQKSAAINSARELQKKNEELMEVITELKNENERIKEKLKVICKKIVESVDLAQYEFLELKSTEPDEIDVKDLVHMVQQLSLLATQISQTDKIESHVEALEYRITELSNENSTNFKTKLKLQERLEFIMQERDVWKRNAETLKKMYAKLSKEREREIENLSSIENSVRKCLVGSNSNINMIDLKHPNKRTFTATIPRKYIEDVRASNISDIQLNTVENRLINEINDLENLNKKDTVNNENNLILDGNIQTNTNYNNLSLRSSPNKENTIASQQSIIINSLIAKANKSDQTNSQSVNNQSNNNHMSQSKLQFNDNEKIVFLDFKRSDSNKSSTDIMNNSNQSLTPNSTFFTPTPTSDRQQQPLASKKYVSFNKDIDVRLFPKNTKITKSFEPYILPLSQDKTCLQINEQDNNNDISNSSSTSNESQSIVLEEIKNFNNNNTLNANRPMYEINHFLGLSQSRNLSATTNRLHYSSTDSLENKFSKRASICSNRKFPGETPVKDLEPTLKMIIIKELSAEKVNGSDWRMFAKRIGISDNEINNWTALKLQFPMARVLSFWSSNPDATTRLLHRHLSAPCFNYNALIKRIENFYDVF